MAPVSRPPLPSPASSSRQQGTWQHKGHGFGVRLFPRPALVLRWHLLPLASNSASCHKSLREAPSMKLFALVLMLAVLAGSQAFLLSDEPTPRLEQVLEAFWEYVAKATSSTEKTMELIRKSELGQEINRISHSLVAANSYGTELQMQLPPGAQELVAKLSKDAEMLVQKIAGDLRELTQKVQPYTEELQARLAPYAEELLEQAEQRAETLRRGLMAGTQELSEKLQQNVEELRSQLGPYAQELSGRLQQHGQEFQQGLEPYVKKLQGSLSQGVQHVRRNLYPYAEDLPQKLNPYAEDLQGRLGSFWASFLQHFQ
ncbi:apolipoprotein A-IV-like isoform X2 [Gopherus flavomarginatus]|uniref:apolipoprotein A-IV-like isoform X2 n=1 Tax=Gopherus flavomarginatus TaxID=286002 RepID=UPI0021CBE228|nr:apolipoprotein A-IV-like isoform X2 [Gopherus flavomarginatus]